MNKYIPIFIIQLVLIGCQSQFEMPEEGNGCPETGILASDSLKLNESNYYLPQYYQQTPNAQCQRRTCLNGKWEGDSDYACPFSCMDTPGDNPDKPYCGECINNDQRCDGNTTQICKDGRWKLSVNCNELGTSCIKVDNSATCGACLNGEDRFYNSPTNICRHMTCKDAIWILDEDYCGLKEVSCNLNLTECGECLNNDVKCEDNRIYQCVGGSWLQNNECEFSCSEIIDENQNIQYLCGECTTGDSKHWNNPDNGICVFSKCENGKWVDDYNDCPNGSCILDDAGKYLDCGNCLNNTNQCNDKIYQICKNGNFEDILACDSCNNSICMKSCSAKNKCTQDTDTIATFCNSEGQIEFCPAGCTSDSICMNCQDGEQIFKEEDDICSYRTCKNNLYPEAYTKCTDTNNKGVSCIKDNNNQFSCGECKNDSKKCEQTTLSCTCQICQNGQWTKLCTNNYSCKGTADNYSNCGECTNSNSDYYYQEGTTCYHKKCSNGTWSPVQKCNSNNSCTGTAGKYNNCGECINGKKYNVTEASGLCNYRECSAGKLGAIQRCPNGVSCNKARTDCGVCYNKKTKCEQGYLFTCTDGAWPAKGTFCPKGCHSSGEKCKL